MKKVHTFNYNSILHVKQLVETIVLTGLSSKDITINKNIIQITMDNEKIISVNTETEMVEIPFDLELKQVKQECSVLNMVLLQKLI